MRLRPVLVHLWPAHFGMGGVPKFVCQLSNWAADWAEVHILFRLGTDHFWQSTTKATFQQCDTPLDTFERLRELQPDLVHHHFPAEGFLVSELQGLSPLVGTAHGWHYGCKDAIGDWVHPVSGPSRRVIRLGVAVEQYQVKSHHAEKHLVVGIVGRRGKDKLPDSFLDRLAQGIPPGITLRVIGDSPHDSNRDRITARLEELPIELMGTVPADLMPHVYQQLDALLVPSATESVSYVALEAMASGLPVVARNVDGLPYTLETAGLLCEDDDQLLAALERLRDDPALRRHLGRLSRERVEQFYTLDRMLAEYGQAYAEATGGRIRCPDPTLDCSVVIPVFNTPPQWLQESLDSVLAQTGRFEIVLIDDGSTNPDTLAALHAYASRDNVRLLRHKTNQGTPAALNRGVLAARSDVIVRHDSDDIMLPGRIARQVQYLKEHPETALVSGQMHLIDENGHPLAAHHVSYDPSLPMWNQPNEVNPILHPSATYRRHAVIHAGLYPPDRQCQDLALWCAMQLAGYKMDVLNDYCVKYRVWDWEAKTKTRIGHDRAVRDRFKALAATKPPHLGAAEE